MEEDRQPWERQRGENGRMETPQAYAAFLEYRDMPPAKRSLTRLAEQRQCARSIVARWCMRWNWVERADAWDEYQRLERERENAEAIKDMAKRHAMIATAVQQKVIERLQELAGQTIPLSPFEMARLLEVSAKVEREALGLPSKMEVAGPNGGAVQMEHSFDLSKLLDEDLDNLESILSKAILTND